MVDTEVEKDTKALLLGMFPGMPGEMIDYAFKCRVLDVNKCRIAIIKRYYYSKVDEGLTAYEAREETGRKFCRSEKTIENIIYNQFYKDIRI